MFAEVHNGLSASFITLAPIVARYELRQAGIRRCKLYPIAVISKNILIK